MNINDIYPITLWQLWFTVTVARIMNIYLCLYYHCGDWLKLQSAIIRIPLEEFAWNVVSMFEIEALALCTKFKNDFANPPWVINNYVIGYAYMHQSNPNYDKHLALESMCTKLHCWHKMETLEKAQHQRLKMLIGIVFLLVERNLAFLVTNLPDINQIMKIFKV